jgi:hypothetical protein
MVVEAASNPNQSMKLLPVLLILATSSAMLHAEEAPKKGGATGPGGEKIREMMLQRFDANKNGTLEPEERQAAMKAYQKRKAGTPKGGSPGTAGPEGAKGAKLQEMLLQRFDANNNGVMDPEEREAAMKAMQERKGKAEGIPSAGVPAAQSGGSKFRRPPEAPKPDAPK